jgi:hypothetical protein
MDDLIDDVRGCLCLKDLFIIRTVVKKRASDYCLTPTQLFFSYIMARTSYIQ